MIGESSDLPSLLALLLLSFGGEVAGLFTGAETISFLSFAAGHAGLITGVETASSLAAI